MPPDDDRPRAAHAAGASPEATASTRERILAAAQSHFITHGLQHASVRAITRLAGANAAAVVYYFGSKEALFAEVLGACVKALVEPRLAALDALEAAAGDAPLPVADVVRVLAEPYVLNRADTARPAAVYARFYGRMYAEPNDVHRRVVRDGFDELQQRFLRALHKAIPAVPLDELVWRFATVLTALVHVAADTGVVQRLAPATASHDDHTLLAMLVGAYTAMLETPPTRLA